MHAAIAERLARGGQGRTEADIQADVRAFLLAAPLQLAPGQVEVALEAPVGGGRRIDVEAGCAVIEVKKSLVAGASFDAAVAQLAGYVRDRAAETGIRVVGVLTDGRQWILYHLAPDDQLAEVDRFALCGREDADRLAAWLEVILPTARQVRPTPDEILRHLGVCSPGTQLDLADLAALYEACRNDPEVVLKRELWSRLLLCSLGTGFEDSDAMFVTHTYLVLVAELIAHEVMGLPVDASDGDVRGLLEGRQFTTHGLHGVVEADFFDWPAVVPQGGPIVAGIARRLAAFDWSAVEHDVLKALYESLIDRDTRRKLGEYYTPDWLAQKIVDEQFTHPLRQRLLDPACGSGTFLFWAVRRFLAACDAAGVPNERALELVVDHVQGIDLHPVAVTLARVTYLLALTKRRLARRSELSIPVFLGDSVRWQHDRTVRTDDGLTISTADPLELIDDTLHFPESVVRDPQRFDRLVADLVARAGERSSGAKPPRIAGLLRRHGITDPADQDALATTFKKLCRLHDAGRDHLWSYYIRNMARPLSFLTEEGQVDLLVGNPPWQSYRDMSKELQQAYRSLAQERGLWAGRHVATQQNISDVFVARVVEQYLRRGGTFAFVLPHAVLSRRQFEGFRTGHWGGVTIRFNAAEEFCHVKPPPFPALACVVAGAKHQLPAQLPRRVTSWRGRLPAGSLDWPSAHEHLAAEQGDVSVAEDVAASPYRERFRQGATLVPRMLVMVEVAPDGPLGMPSGMRRVRSARSASEKRPWKEISSLEGVVEERFIKPIYLGETIAAYRARRPRMAVLPFVRGELLDGRCDAIDEYPGLARWWRNAEEIWQAGKSAASRLTLCEQLDYHGKLHRQHPSMSHRVVYTKSGQHLAACRIDDPNALIDHTLYWAPAASVDEARYLCAVLNSVVLAEAVAGLQAQGLFGARHFDTYVFALPFPQFDADDASHRRLTALAARAERVAFEVPLDDGWQFQRARRVVREALREDGVADEIDEAVRELLADGVSGRPEAPDLIGALQGGPARRPIAARTRRRAKVDTAGTAAEPATTDR